MIEFLNEHFYIMVAIYIMAFLVIVLLSRHFYLKKKGIFGQATLYTRLRKLYDEKDYPWIKEIILPLNDQQYLFYDAIVFGDKHIYLIEMKNQKGEIVSDLLDDWYFIDGKMNQIIIPNAYYDLEVKTHILNKLLRQHLNRYINVIVCNEETTIKPPYDKNRIINVKQIESFIKFHEQKSNLKTISIKNIENMGNFILSKNVSNWFIRRKEINKVKNQRIKK